MSAYGYSEARIEELIERGIGRIRKTVIVCLVLVVGSILALCFHVGNFGLSGRIGLDPFFILFVIGPGIFQFYWNRRKFCETLRRSFSQFSVVVCDGEVRVSQLWGNTRQLQREQIVRLEEPKMGGGLYLRSANRYRWLLIPRSLDEYDQIKSELTSRGIPLVKTVIAASAEGGVICLGLCATLILAWVSQSMPWLTADLTLSLLMAVAGICLAWANPDDRESIWKAAVPSLIPALLITSKIWLVLNP